MSQKKQRLNGLTDLQERPMRVGKLKIGEIGRSATGKAMPTKLDYIKAVDSNQQRIPSFHEKYGMEPKEFTAVFTSDDPKEIMWEAYRRYGSGSGLICHGDGTQAIVEETGETIACPCHYAEGDKPTCKPVASMTVFLFEIPEVGVFQIDTGSIYSIQSMRWFLRFVQSATNGKLKGIPFRIYIEPQQATVNGRKITFYVWKFGLCRGMTPADLQIAAAKVVAGFLPPPVEIDESKPAELYAHTEPLQLPRGHDEPGAPVGSIRDQQQHETLDAEYQEMMAAEDAHALGADIEPGIGPDGIEYDHPPDDEDESAGVGFSGADLDRMKCAEGLIISAMGGSKLTSAQRRTINAAVEEQRNRTIETHKIQEYVGWCERQAEKIAKKGKAA